MLNKYTNSFLVLIVLIIFNPVFADEGLWIPKLIKQQEAKMKSLGMSISAEEIYSEKNKSIKDAVVHFGGGCTASIISDNGLILTNHHCGYSRIQSHSSLENNYLKKGFWAEKLENELPNPGLSASIIREMKDVTSEILEGINEDMSDEEKAELIEENIKKVGEKAIKGTQFDYQVRPFYEGNQFYLIIRETFNDVRLVGAPPSSVGKFGFDSDNWVWPRHTGDFSLFRIYTDKNNQAAEYSEDNIPYKAPRSVEISLKGIKKDDFTMVYGFPGRTYEYLYSKILDYTINEELPLAIEMREFSLSVIDKAIRESEEVSIQYAAKQSRISNAYKKWIGQTGGLKRFKAIEKKQALERKFSTALKKDKKLSKMYGNIYADYDQNMGAYKKYNKARKLFIEFVYYGPEFIRFVNGLHSEFEDDENEDLEENLEKRIVNFYKNYDPEIDKKILAGLTKILFENLDEELLNEELKKIKSQNDYERFADELFNNSTLSSRKKIDTWMDSKNKSSKLDEDPAYLFAQAIYDMYKDNIQSGYSKINALFDDIDKQYMAAQMKVLPSEKDYYPNANSTLRVSYGKVGGYAPRDAIIYEYMTTAEGILQKYKPGNYEYDVPEKLIELIRSKDFGKYGQDGQLPICFIASNHTSGGNSGSPAFNADGQLIGLNFDRTWESTMSDMMFDPNICRNIMVDIRYVLFIIDKFADADRIIEEINVAD